MSLNLIWRSLRFLDILFCFMIFLVLCLPTVQEQANKSDSLVQMIIFNKSNIKRIK